MKCPSCSGLMLISNIFDRGTGIPTKIWRCNSCGEVLKIGH